MLVSGKNTNLARKSASQPAPEATSEHPKTWKSAAAAEIPSMGCPAIQPYCWSRVVRWPIAAATARDECSSDKRAACSLHRDNIALIKIFGPRRLAAATPGRQIRADNLL